MTKYYQKHIQKYSDLAKKIDVKKENVLLVLSDTNITEHTLAELNKLYNFFTFWQKKAQSAILLPTAPQSKKNN